MRISTNASFLQSQPETLPFCARTLPAVCSSLLHLEALGTSGRQTVPLAICVQSHGLKK